MNATPAYRVVFLNGGGELDSRSVSTPEEAAKAAIEMIEPAGALHDGDQIEVTPGAD